MHVWMLPGGAAGALRRCYGGVTEMLLRCYGGVTEVLRCAPPGGPAAPLARTTRARRRRPHPRRGRRWA
eukprot:7895594-Pyramimonas_sp.AAC.2